MSIFQILKSSAIILLLLGALYGLVQMFTSEVQTTKDFTHYFQWAFGAGLVFLAVGAAMVIFDREETIQTPFQHEEKK